MLVQVWFVTRKGRPCGWNPSGRPFFVSDSKSRVKSFAETSLGAREQAYECEWEPTSRVLLGNLYRDGIRNSLKLSRVPLSNRCDVFGDEFIDLLRSSANELGGGNECIDVD